MTPVSIIWSVVMVPGLVISAMAIHRRLVIVMTKARCILARYPLCANLCRDCTAS